MRAHCNPGTAAIQRRSATSTMGNLGAIQGSFLSGYERRIPVTLVCYGSLERLSSAGRQVHKPPCRHCACVGIYLEDPNLVAVRPTDPHARDPCMRSYQR